MAAHPASMADAPSSVSVRDRSGRSGKHLPRELPQDLRAFPVRRGGEARQLHLTGEAQTLRRHHASHLAVARHDRIARLDAGVADHHVIAALGFQRHAIPGLGRQRFRIRPRRDHRLVAVDLPRIGEHRAKAAVFDTQAGDPRAAERRTRGKRVPHQRRHIGAGIAALAVLLHQHRELVAPVECRFALAQFVLVQFQPARAIVARGSATTVPRPRNPRGRERRTTRPAA